MVLNMAITKSGRYHGGTPGNKGGRPVTVDGKRQFNVRVSQELLDQLKAAAAAHDVSLAEWMRLAALVVLESPGDLLTAMAKDPKTERTQLVERVASTSKSSATKRRRPA
jgi:HicB family